MVSSGDSGAEGCDNPNGSSANGDPPSVNVLASSPFTVAVGGTVFNEAGNGSKYWNATNNPSTLASAKSYIPENVWNESCPTCGLWAGGGGASVFFPKPNWQFGVSGIPNDGARDLPDVSLTAAGHDPYLLCFEGSCQQGFLVGISGTSASAPSFAGIMALVVQQFGRQGQADYVLYRLAAGQTPSQCNGSNTVTAPASTCIFNDTTTGNNAVPGETGYGTLSAKYQAAAGYDLASGLGSVNVTNLVNKWNTVTFNATNATLLPSSINASHGSPVSLNVSVAPSSGSGVPTGSVALQTSNNQSVIVFTLTNGSAASQVNNLPGGSYSLTARYSGDATFAPSPPSSPVNVAISPENSTTTISALTADASGHPIPISIIPYGSFIYLRADVAGQSGNGIATGSVSFLDHGNLFFGPVGLNSEGNTAATPSGLYSLAAGQYSVTARYNADSSFNASTSSAASFTITQASTAMTLAAFPTAIAQGASTVLTAYITSSAFGNYPTGTVTFFSGGTQIGTAQVFGTASSPTGVAAAASLNTSSLPTGQDSITAQYTGDANYVASSASPITVNVQADFTFAAGGPSITIPSPGGSGNLALTVAGQTGYNSTINFAPTSCSGLPFGASCGFSPASLTGSGSTTVTVSTTAPRFAGLQRFGWTGFGFAFAGVFLLGIPSRRFRPTGLLSILLVALGVALTGCGGGSGGGGGGGHTQGTPVGSYVITVTATGGSITHSTNFTLIVN
jgi:hypothetical protein